MRKELKLLFLGFLLWLIPFIVSFFFYDMETKQLAINEFFFKSIMIVLSALVGTCFLVYYFRGISSNYVKEGLIAGFVFAAISWILDVLVLLPMSGMDFGAYFTQIGMRYLIAPVIAVGMGMAVSEAKK